VPGALNMPSTLITLITLNSVRWQSDDLLIKRRH